jgi:hypothetical protein
MTSESPDSVFFAWRVSGSGIRFPCMTYLSVQATSIQSITRTLTWALRAHLDPVAVKAGEVLFPGGVPPGVDMRAMCLGFVEALERNADEVAHRDREVARERSEDDDARIERDRVTAKVRAALLLIRDAASGAFGADVLRTIGLTGRLPEHAEALLAFTRNTVTKLPLLATKTSAKAFVQFDAIAAAADLDELGNALAAALTSVARDARETQMAQAARNAAVERWRLHYTTVANLIEGLLRMAGFHHVADRVRPTRRRRAGETEPEDGLETQPPAEGLPGDVVALPGLPPASPEPSKPAE